MTLEAQPYRQNPEGISAQHRERFNKLQIDIVERIKPHHSKIIVSSDDMDPPSGIHISITYDGIWSIGFGREGIEVLNETNEPVGLLELLKKYALVQNTSRLKETVNNPDPNPYSEMIPRYFDVAIEELEKSAEHNPGPFAEGLLKSMESSLRQLSA